MDVVVETQKDVTDTGYIIQGSDDPTRCCAMHSRGHWVADVAPCSTFFHTHCYFRIREPLKCWHAASSLAGIARVFTYEDYVHTNTHCWQACFHT